MGRLVRRSQFFLLENRRGRGEWGLFPPPTDPKIIEIWLNLRFISSEVRLLVGKNPGVDLITLLATNRGAPEQRKLALCCVVAFGVLSRRGIKSSNSADINLGVQISALQPDKKA
jgi:hypothetical protein